MSQISIMWIRDGVLVDRMHVNPVAFAVAYMAKLEDNADRSGLLEDLINFGFEKSGISCADKMRLYNAERENLLSTIDEAAAVYNELATLAAEQCGYFEGAVELLRDLSARGVKNYITSAVEQEVLDKWKFSPQGKSVSPYLTEILGKRENFSKGHDHFRYVSECSDETYYVADAVSEIATGKKYSSQFHVHPIGFAHAITKERVVAAFNSILTALRSVVPDCYLVTTPPSIDADRLRLESGEQVARALTEAGAEFTVSGPQMYQSLRAHLDNLLLN